LPFGRGASLRSETAGYDGFNHAERRREHARLRFLVLPPCSPALVPTAGKQKRSRRATLNHLKSLREFGAGEGIRTLDPNLGKFISHNAFGADGGTRTRTLREKQIFLPLRLSPPPSRRSWPGLSLRHGFSAEGAARPVSTPSLNRGLGSGLAWGSSPLAFPDFERFCSTNFPVGTPIGSLLRLPISPRPHCQTGAMTRFVAQTESSVNSSTWLLYGS
jgi:hypothetical protein